MKTLIAMLLFAITVNAQHYIVFKDLPQYVKTKIILRDMSAAKEDVAFAKRLDGAMADYNGMKLINVEFLEIEFEQIWNMGQMFKWDTNFAKSFYNKSYVKNAYGFVLASPSLEDTIYVPRQIVKINTTATKPLIKSVRKKK